MAFDFRTRRVNFVPTTGGDNLQRDQKVVFSSAVRRAEAVIKGFEIGYTGDDHHVWRERVEIKNVHVVESNGVCFDIDYLFRDKSGDIDDRYSGWVDVVVMAEVA